MNTKGSCNFAFCKDYFYDLYFHLFNSVTFLTVQIDCMSLIYGIALKLR